MAFSTVAVRSARCSGVSAAAGCQIIFIPVITVATAKPIIHFAISKPLLLAQEPLMEEGKISFVGHGKSRFGTTNAAPARKLLAFPY
ncbi:hypothetical protein [Sphingomonas sp. PAMC 26605]|uniref:hypothetical protein n=1 Tax=Sphingomonas sp. PAMC 26605 TaxID=1112214 RepID=UPI0012F50AD9|nr:hypothetical protein [Sphingomonas sp. PAMC 26605]